MALPSALRGRKSRVSNETGVMPRETTVQVAAVNMAFQGDVLPIEHSSQSQERLASPRPSTRKT
jgi:hypothetical protein